jgi:hypothetical protein
VLIHLDALTDPSSDLHLMGTTSSVPIGPTQSGPTQSRPPQSRPTSIGALSTMTAPRLYECQDCGQMQVLPAMPPGARAICLRCDAVLRHTRRDPLILPAR